MPKDNIVTKSFVKETVNEAVDKAKDEITEAMGILQNDMQSRIEDSENRLDKKISQSHNTIIGKLDEISGQIKTFEEEHAVLSMHSSENYDKLDDHEKRIIKLEAALPT